MTAPAAPAKSYTVPATLKITQEGIDNLLCSALEGGITYWCSEAKVVSPTSHPKGEPYVYASDALTRGHALQLRETGDGDVNVTHTITITDLLLGIAKAIETGKWHLSHFAGDDQDAETADVAVQYAIFGDIRYG